MKYLIIFGLALLGLVIVGAGFIYFILFAGIPYQDPTPDLQANYSFHFAIAALLSKTGGIVFLLGLLAIPFLCIMTGRVKPRHNFTSHLE